MKRGSTQYFDSLAREWPGLYASKNVFRDRLDLFLRKVQSRVTAPARILDVGCGPGVMALALARMNYQVVGADAAPNMIRQADMERRKYGINNAHFMVMEASQWAFEEQSFDAVICSSVVQYIHDDRRFIGEIAAVLRPGGLLLISVPHRGSVLSIVEGLSARAWRSNRSPGRGFLNHSLRQYGRRDFLQTLESSSFEKFDCTFFECPLFGSLGITLSRYSFVGMMLLVAARRKRAGKGNGADVDAVIPQKRWQATRAISRKNLWENLHPFAKSVLGRTGAFVSPDIVLGRIYRRTKRLIRGAQWWSAEQSREYQFDQLRRMLALAHEKSAYYRRTFRAIGFEPGDFKSVDELAALPTIERKTIRAHLDEMCTTSPHSGGVDYTSTGGSSGAPLRFYIGADRSPMEYAYLVACWERAGYDLRIPQAVFRGQVVPEDRNGIRHSWDPILRRHFYSNFHMSDKNMRRYLEHISSIGPCFLHVYPSSVAVLARFIRRSGCPVPRNIRGILAGSENVYTDDRQTVEETFGSRYLSWFGHSEKLVMAAECEHTTDYHVWPTYGYFELLDEAGRQVTKPGQRGEIVGTGFINTIVPFIRYRTGDYATYVADRCKACGRQHPIIREIRGHRTQEMLVAGDNSLISWTAVNMHDDTFESVRQFQFAQSRAGRATLKIVPTNGFDATNMERIRHNLNRKLEGRLAFDVELVDAIPLTPSGKSTFVDQRMTWAALPREA